MWGGPVPDPVMGLAKALASLTDERGRVIPSLRAGVRELDAEERAELEALPFDEADFKRQAGMVEGAELCGEPELPVLARLWHEPSLTIIALEARALEGSSNQVIEAARARISLRTVATQDPEAIRDALVEALRAAVPWGLEVVIEPEPVAGWWRTDPHGAAFEAARRALAEGYGRASVAIGCGGSIGFVEPFAKVLGGVPALLTGVEDPACLAHSENESLCLADFAKGMKANVHLYAELSTALSVGTAK
jgi:acetylornithine deacetylase/succinyl-diaminopimelate desuccinylase-like protein